MINLIAEKDNGVFSVDSNVFKNKICDLNSPTFLRFAKSNCDLAINSYINPLCYFIMDSKSEITETVFSV